MVKSWLAEGRGGVVTGPIGSGKSRVVRDAVNGAWWVDLRPGPLLGTRFVVDLTTHLEDGGAAVLQAMKSEGIRAAVELAERYMNGTPLVVDQCELLAFSTDWDHSDPSQALWLDERKELVQWLTRRLSDSTTVVVRRGVAPFEDAREVFHHAAPAQQPEPPGSASGATSNWLTLVELAHHRPGILKLARAAFPYIGAEELRQRIKTLKQEESGPWDVLRYLGGMLHERAPTSWLRALSLVASLGDAPSELVKRTLRGAPKNPYTFGSLSGSRSGSRSRSHSGSSWEAQPLRSQEPPELSALIRLGLIEERAGTLSVLPVVQESGALIPPSTDDLTELLRRAAMRTMESVNDVSSLEPWHARQILRAHSLYLELGDNDNAFRTAQLHVGGLVELARRTSRDEREWQRARRQYEAIRDLIEKQPEHWKSANDGRRVRSYVLHYWAWNGRRAGTLPLDRVLEAWREAVDLWPDNALWHQRLIQGLIEGGRFRDARQALNQAYTRVGVHPRRDDLLRLRPAETAMTAGAPLIALELIEPVLDLDVNSDPDGAARLHALLEWWQTGVRLGEIPGRSGVVRFNQELTVQLQRGATRWLGRVGELDANAWESLPSSAIRALGDRLAKETEELVRTPSHRLSDDRLRRKGRLIGAIDLLNSDLGLEHASHRWLVGRLDEKNNHFLSVQQEFPPLELHPKALPSGTRRGLFYAKVPVFRDGSPSGPIEEIRDAGSGRTLRELLDELRMLSLGEDLNEREA